MYLKLIINIIIYIALFVISSIVLHYFNSPILKVVTLIVFLFIYFIISVKFYPFNITRYYSFSRDKFIWIIISLLLPCLSFVSIYTVTYFAGYLKSCSIDTTNILGNIASQLYIGFTEEIFARGLIFYSLFRKTNNFYIAVIISSLIFSLFHSWGNSIVENWPLFISYFTIGIILCFIMLLSKSIWPCVIFHFTNNLLTKLIEYNFGEYEKYLTQLSPIIFWPYYLPLLLFTVYLLMRKQFNGYIRLINKKSPQNEDLNLK